MLPWGNASPAALYNIGSAWQLIGMSWWHLQRIMRPSNAHASEQLDLRCIVQTYHIVFFFAGAVCQRLILQNWMNEWMNEWPPLHQSCAKIRVTENKLKWDRVLMMKVVVYTVNLILHRESKKTCHQTFVYIFTKYPPILKILSLTYFVVNLQ